MGTLLGGRFQGALPRGVVCGVRVAFISSMWHAEEAFQNSGHQPFNLADHQLATAVPEHLLRSLCLQGKPWTLGLEAA